jgi:UDP-N-acetylglucosamine 2-epimerase (non-hydrolysing)
VEAGLRSFDREMPEEINRIITDAISDHLFVTEQSGLDNLKNEGIDDSKISLVGNVMIDSLLFLMHKAEKSGILNQLNLKERNYALVTLHRPSNVDHEDNLNKILDALTEIQKSLPVVFPIHPRTEKNLEKYKIKKELDDLKKLLIIPPVGYLDFIKLQSNATFIITDSGGIQEESTFMGIPCLTTRENTERPVTCTLGTNEIVGTDTRKIISLSQKIINGEWKKGTIPPLWDGKSAERIVEVLVGKYS